MEKIHQKKMKIGCALDVLSLCALLQYVIYRFLQSTMFVLFYSNTYKLITMGLLLVFGGIRYLYIVINRLKDYKEKSDKIKFFLRCGGAWLLALPFFYVGWLHDYKVLIFMPICCMCLFDMEAEKVLKYFVVLISFLLMATVICCLSGAVRNIVEPWMNRGGAYGIINSSDFAAYFTFVLLTLWCAMQIESRRDIFLFALFNTVVSVLVFFLSNSRTGLFCCGLFLFVSIWYYIENQKSDRIKCYQIITRNINFFLAISFLLFGIVIIVLASRYGAGDSLAIRANDLLSNRLDVTWQSLVKYGIHPFGVKLHSAHGNGATIVGFGWSTEGYGYLDIAYSMLLIRYGWVIALIVSGLWIWMTVRALKSGKNRIAFVLMIFAMHALSEARVLDINYNVFLAMPFCSMKKPRTKTKQVEESNRIKGHNNAIPFLVAMAEIAGILCFAPRILSRLRSFFYFNKWNSGLHSVYAFIACIIIIFLVVSLWNRVSLFLEHRDRVTAIHCIGVLLIIILANVVVSHTINQGKKERYQQLQTEKDIIEQIVEVSTQPVYAAEFEEIYRGNINGLSAHVFSIEEYGKVSEGSMIVDRNTEIYWGGQYTKLSEWSGLYSKDPSVISFLKNRGYTWTSYYSEKRMCNLPEVARFNDINMGDTLEIEGPRVVNTLEMDQLAGIYEVCFIFSINDYQDECEGIILEVKGEAGDRTIQKAVIKQEYYDNQNHCTYTMKYRIQDVPKVCFSINLPEKVNVTLEEISWKQIDAYID